MSQIVGFILIFMRQLGAMDLMKAWHEARGSVHSYAHKRSSDGRYAPSTIEHVKTAISKW